MEPKKENRGGKRVGAGRKPADMHWDEVKNLVKAFRRKAKEAGKTVDDLLADIAYDLNEGTRYRLKAMEIYKNCTVTKHTHQTVEKIEGPQIMLPPLKPKPIPPHMEVEEEHRVH